MRLNNFRVAVSPPVDEGTEMELNSAAGVATGAGLPTTTGGSFAGATGGAKGLSVSFRGSPIEEDGLLIALGLAVELVGEGTC